MIEAKMFNKAYSLAEEEANGLFSPEESWGVIKYFFKEYYEFFGESHPPLSINTLKTIIVKMPYVDKKGEPEYYDCFDVLPEDYKVLIKSYFNDYTLRCDYSIVHFFSGDIRYYRYLNTLFQGECEDDEEEQATTSSRQI